MTGELAQIAPGEWAGVASFAAAAIGAVWRAAHKMFAKIDANLRAIATNTAETGALKLRVEQLAVKQETMNTEGSIPMQRVLRELGTANRGIEDVKGKVANGHS